MVDTTKENIIKTKNMVMVYLNGTIIDSIKDNGLMGNNMEEVFIQIMINNKKKEFGKTEKE
jgi:hypothetical protein